MMNSMTCPSCGVAIPAEETTSGTIQRCPRCGQVIGTRHQTNSIVDLDWTPLELGWSLHSAVIAAFTPFLHELQSRSQKAEGPAAYADANEPGLFHRACMMGMAAITDLAREEPYSPEVRSALRDLSDYYSELLAPLQQPSQALLIAAPDLRKIQHLTGMAGILHKGAQAANPQTIRGTAALGGAAFGSIIMPGVGTAIGGALGWWLGSGEAKIQDKVAIEHFQTGVRLMWSAIEDLLRNTWNRICRRLVKKGGPDLPDSAFFETANVRWDNVRSRFSDPIRPENRDAVRVQIQSFCKDWGPHPEALAHQCRLCLVPFPLDLVSLAGLTKKIHDLYPSNPLAYEPYSRLYLEQGKPIEALEWAEAGLRLAPGSVALQQTRIEILASLDRLAEAESRIGQFNTEEHTTSPRLHLIRGLIRAGKPTEALSQARLWIQQEGKPAVVVRDLSSFPGTASLLNEYRHLLPELNSVLSGKDGKIQAAIQHHLSSDGKTSFFGPLSPNQDQLFREHLPINAGEIFLYAHDWSEWALLKGFLGITNRHLLWQHGWDNLVTIDWLHLDPNDVHYEKSILHVGKQSIDVKNEPLATALAKTSKEIVEIVRS